MKCPGCATEIGDARICENCGYDNAPAKVAEKPVKVSHKKKSK